MVTVGLTNDHYDMIIELIDSHLENMINAPHDKYTIGAINEWLDLLRALNDWDLLDTIREYESILDDIQNGEF